MSIIDPPPSRIKDFTYIWKNWLNNLWEFIQNHTGGPSAGGTGTGSNWNAHGDTALGDSTSPLKIENSSFYIEGTAPASPVGDTPTSGAGSRFMVVGSKKYALRTGTVSSTQWDNANIGDYSIAFGLDCIASGTGSLAIGADNTASFPTTIAIGDTNVSSGTSATCIGYVNTATSFGNISIGGVNTSSGNVLSTAIGLSNEASGNYAIAIGNDNIVSNSNGMALGGYNEVDQITSMAIGNTNVVLGRSSMAIGSFCKSTSLRCHVIGTGISAVDPLLNSVQDTLVIGIRSDKPTLTLTGGDGTSGSVGKCGIADSTTPLSTLDVGGSVGYKYENLTYAADDNGSGYTLLSTSEFLTFTIDFDNGETNTTFTFNLPEITSTSIDRRMYHIFNETASGTGNFVDIKPYTGQYIYQYSRHGIGGTSGVTQNGTIRLGPGEAIQIVAAFNGYDTGAGRQPTWRVL